MKEEKVTVNFELKESTYNKLKAMAGLKFMGINRLLDNILVEYLEKVDFASLAREFEEEKGREY